MALDGIFWAVSLGQIEVVQVKFWNWDGPGVSRGMARRSVAALTVAALTGVTALTVAALTGAVALTGGVVVLTGVVALTGAVRMRLAMQVMLSTFLQSSLGWRCT
jgi:hypothetical protein